jgi:hypothetical protein
MASLTAPSALAWSMGAEGVTTGFPIRAMLRLNRGATADLSISVVEPGMVLAFETSSGLITLSESPVLVQRFDRSGIYDQSLVLNAAPGTASVTLLLRVSSSDGAAETERTVQIQPLPGS